jgi:hypothetical protein
VGVDFSLQLAEARVADQVRAPLTRHPLTCHNGFTAGVPQLR